MSDLAGNPGDRFSRDMAQLVFQIIAKSIRDLLNLEEPNWNKSISLPPRSDLGRNFTFFLGSRADKGSFLSKMHTHTYTHTHTHTHTHTLYLFFCFKANLSLALHQLQVYLIIMLSLGSIETDRVISETML